MKLRLTIKDQLDREISLTEIPSRIVSLVPSLTGLLIELGLQQAIVGLTEFCPYISTAVCVGGTKDFSIEKIKSLNPDLVIACKEENSKEGIEQLTSEFPVWIGDINDLEDAMEAINAIGEMTGQINQASVLSTKIMSSFSNSIQEITSPGVVYLIWRKPYMTVGGDTFISDMIDRAGFKNLYNSSSRYPGITIEDLASLKPEFIFLSSEPFPFNQRHIAEFQNQCPDSKIVLVQGEYFSWYGSKLLESASYFEELRRDLLI